MPLFCCNSVKPYRPRVLNHEVKFSDFVTWAAYPRDASLDPNSEADLTSMKSPYAVQLVRQVNYGPLEAKRYFVPGDGETFVEVSENSLIQANFQKLNSYKNFKCEEHGKFFEVNLYQKDPVNKHHWRANLARPASTIDL